MAKESGGLKHRINSAIRASKVKLIDDVGTAHGEVLLSQALAMALEKNLDLVEIGKDQNPPICKLMNYGKFRYQESKKLQNLKKKQKQVLQKELKFRPKIEQHDLGVKLNQIRGFVGEGHKVKVTMQLRGRETQHAFLAEELLNKIIDELKDHADVESRSKLDLRNQMVVFVPAKKAK